MKAIKAKLQETKPDRVEAFEKGAAVYAKKIIADIDNYDFVSFVFLNHLCVSSYNRHL